MAEPAMDRKIFDMGLGVESVSIYILCCALKDAGAQITMDNLTDKWNGDRMSLKKGIDDLERKHIIQKIQSASESMTRYAIVPSGFWRN